MFTAILGVVAIVGVLSVSIYGLLSGPVKTAATVTAKSKATNEMITAAQLIMGMAADSDTDGTREAPEFKDPTLSVGEPNPVGGGHFQIMLVQQKKIHGAHSRGIVYGIMARLIMSRRRIA